MKFFIFRAVSLTILLLLLQGCQDDDVPGIYPEVGSIYQQGFSLEEFGDPVIRENLVVDWSDPKEFTDTDGTILYEFDAQVGNGTVLEGQGSTLAQKYSVTVAKVVDGRALKYRVVRFLSNDNRSMAPVSFRDKADFTGTVYHYDLKGRTERLEGYKDGVLKAVSEGTGKGGISLASRAPKDCLPDDPYCDGGFFIYEPVSHYTDWYNVRGNRLDYSHSTYEYTSYIKVWVPSNGGGAPARSYHEHLDAPAPHGPGSSGHASNHPEEIILDKSFTDIKKIHCTYEQLEKGTTLKDLLKDFFGKDSEFDLNFKVVGNLNCNGSDDPSGCTKANYNYESKKVEILVDKDYINSDQTPTIFIALTLIHEAIHANLFLAVKKLNGGVVPKSSDFAVLYEQYRTKKNWQHEYMADKYVDVIAGAIKKVHPLLGDATFINDRNTNFPDWNWDKFYKNLAWGGLDKTTKGEEYYQSHTKELSIYYDGAKADSTKKTKCED